MESPNVEFFSIYPGAPLPTRAGDDMMGMMPTRAAQLCLPVRKGSGSGYLVYAPVDFTLRWDGRRTELAWGCAAQPTGWEPLDGGLEVRLPEGSGFVDSLSVEQKADLPRVTGGVHPPGFANAHPRTQSDVEITLGLVARTSPGWGLLVRPIPSPLQPLDYSVFDGFLETDWYRGFIPVILRLTSPGGLVRFYRHTPIAQLVPMPLEAWDAESNASDKLQGSRGVPAWTDGVWDEFVRTRAERTDPDRQRGSYMRSARRAASNARCPYTGAEVS